MTSTTGNDTLIGTAGEDVLDGLSGHDVLVGGAGNDELSGGGGDDVFVAGQGNDLVNGGSGNDIAVYDGHGTDYQVIDLGNGQWQVTDLRAGSPNGTDLLTGIEHIRFLGDDVQPSEIVQLSNPLLVAAAEQVIATHGGIQLASVTTLSNGDHLFTWLEANTVKGQIVSAAGALVSGTLSLGSASGKTSISAFADNDVSNGGFVAANIFGGVLTIRRYDSAGAYIQGSEQQIANVTPYSGAGASNGLGTYNYRASVATHADGSFIVTWNSSGVDGVGDGIRAQRFDSTGQPAGGIFQVNTVTTDYQILPVVTILANDNVLISWQSGAVASQYDAKAQLYTSGGQPIGGEFALSAVAGVNEGTLSVSAMPNGGFVATWFTLESFNGSPQDVYARVFTADGAPVGAAFRVNSSTSSYQWNPSVTVLADNSFVVTWDSAHSDIYYDIVGQRFDAFGNALGGEFTINTYTTGMQRLSSITADVDGGFTVAWQSADGTIRTRSFDNIGNIGVNQLPTEQPEVVISTGTGVKDANVITLGNGNHLFTWNEGTASKAQVISSTGQAISSVLSFGSASGKTNIALLPGGGFVTAAIDGSTLLVQRYTNAGVANGAPQTISGIYPFATPGADNGAGTHTYRASIAVLGDGSTIVTWNSAGADGNNDGVLAQRFDSSGAAVGTPYVVNTNVSGYQEHPVVTSLSNGNYIIAWQGMNTGVQVDIKAQLYSSAGVKISGEIALSDSAANHDATVSISALPDGGFVATYFTLSPLNGSSDDVYVRIFDQNGVPVGPSLRVNTETANYQWRPSVAALTNGTFVVTWDNGSNGYDISGQIYDGAGNRIGGEFTINTYTTGNQISSAVTADANGGFTVVWQSDDNTIRSRSYLGNGAPVNQAPTSVVDNNTAPNSVAENAAAGTVVGVTALASDPDVGDTLSYSLSDNPGGRFQIDPMTGVVTVANGASLDYEAATNHSITVVATDSGGLTKSETFTIAVTNVNEAPVTLVDNNTATNTVAENAAAGTTVGVTALASDPDAGDTLTYSLSDNAGGRFQIDAATGVVTVASGALLDYEVATSHSITVVATDSGGLARSETFTINVTNTNEAPVTLLDNDTAANTVTENATTGTVVGVTALASDLDAGDTLTYSLSDNAGGRFQIDAATGVVTVANGALLDYEAATSHSITVVATDAGGLTRSETFSIAVTNVNEAPTALVDSNTSVNAVAENAATGTVVGITALASDPDAGDTLTYSLSDNASGRFQIDAATGVVTVANGALLDHEVATSHNITVVVTDAGGLTKSETFTVAITNVNEAPTAPVDNDTAANTVAENAAAGTVIGITALASDPDAGDTLTYSLSDNAGGRFQIDAATGVVTVANGTLLDYETATSHSITVVATDSGGLAKSETFTIAVTNVNEAPTTIALSNTYVIENTAGAEVGVLTVTDPDAGDSHSFAVSDSRFEVVAGKLKLKTGISLDFEAEPSLVVTVTATDTGALSKSQAFTINTVDAAEQTGPGPDIIVATGGSRSSVTRLSDGRQLVTWLSSAGGAKGRYYNTAGVALGAEFSLGTAIGFSAVASQPDGGFVTAQVGVSGQLRVQRYDASAQPVGTAWVAAAAVTDSTYGYSIYKDRISVTSFADGNYVVVWGASGADASGSGVVGQRFDSTGGLVGGVFPINSLTTGDQSLADVIALSNGGFVAVWSDYGSNNGDVRGQIYDAQGQQVGTGSFLINTTTGADQFAPALAATSDGGFVAVWNSYGQDAPSDWGVYGQRFDSAGQKVGGEFPINTTIASNQYHVQTAGLTDGGFAVVWYSTTGSGVYGQRYNASGQKVGGEFSIDTPGAGGSEPFISALPNGGFAVTWTGSGGVVHMRTFGAGNLNVSPFDLVDTNAAANAVVETSVANVPVGITAHATDVDAGDTLSYSLLDDAGGRFKIDAVTGVVSVANGALIDFETATSHVVVVKATDGGGLFVTRSFTIQVQDGNDAPTAIMLSSATVAENDTGAVIGSLTVSDPNAGDTHTLSVSDNRFEIVGGQLKLKAGVSLNYEATPTLNVTVIATDNGGLSKAQVFNIAITDVNEAPLSVGLSNMAVPEMTAGAAVGSLTVVDPDVGDSHSFSVSDNRFEVVSGQLKLKAGVSLDFATEPNLVVSVTATDAGGLSKTESFNLSVIPISSYVPVANGVPNIIVATGTQAGDASQVTTLSDGRQLVTWTSGSTVKGRFFNALGQALGSELSLDTISTGKASVSALTGGGFVTARYTSSTTLLSLQRYDAAGVAVGAAWTRTVSIGASLDNLTLRPSITTLSDGGYVVVWDSTNVDGNGQGVAGQRFDSAGNTVGGVFSIATLTTSDQIAPDVVALPNGGFVVVWVSSALPTRRIRGQVYDALGQQVPGGEFAVSTNVTYGLVGSQVAVLADGGFIVAWQSGGQDGSSYGIFAQRFDKFGAKVGTEFQVNNTASGDQRHVDVIGLTNGGYVMVWTDNAGGTYGQIYNATGAKVGGDFQANTTATPSFSRPSLAALPNGGFTVSWTDSTGDILTRIYGVGTLDYSGADGLVGGSGSDVLDGKAGNDTLIGSFGNDTLIGGLGNDVAVFSGKATDYTVTTLGNGQIQVADNRAGIVNEGTDILDGVEQLRFLGDLPARSAGNTVVATGTQAGDASQVTTLSDGRQLVTWTSGSTVKGRFFNALGQAAGAELSLDTISTGKVSVSALAGGGFVTARIASSSTLLSVQRYDAAGVAVGSAWTRSASFGAGIDNLSIRPSITTLSDGGYVVVWDTTGIDTTGQGIAGQRFDSAGNAVSTVFRVDTASGSDQIAPDVVALPNGGFVVVWVSSALPTRRIRGQIYDAQGQQVGGGEFSVSTNVTYTLVGSQVAVLADGGFIVAWQSGGQDSSSYGIFAQRFDKFGTKIGTEFQVNTIVSGDQRHLDVIGLADGGYVMVWTDNTGGTFGQVYNAMGTKVGGDFQVNTTATPSYSRPSLAALPNGGFTVSWTDTTGDILTRTYSASTLDYSGADGLVGGSGSDVLDGKAGNDTLIGSFGNDTLIGGLGNDVAVFSGKATDYTVTTLGNGQIQVADNRAGIVNEGTDILDGVEQLRFLGDLPARSAASIVTAAPTGDVSQVTALSDGRQLVTWTSGSTVKGRFFNVLGQALGSELSLDTISTGIATVSALAGGGFVTARIASSSTLLSVQRYDAAGVAVGSAWTRPASFGGGVDNLAIRPSITTLSDGGYVVVWDTTGIDMNGQGIAGQRFDSAGNAVGTVFRVNTASGSDQIAPDVVALRNGGFVVVWASSALPTRRIRGQIYDAQGQQVGGGEFSVSTNVTYGLVGSQVAVLADGGFIVAWQSGGQDSSSYGIFAQRFDQFGTKIGTEFQVNTTVSGDQRHLDVIGLADGGFVMVWTGNSGGTFGQVYNAMGTKVGGEFQVNTAATPSYSRPAVAALPNGGFTVSWTSSTGAILTRSYTDSQTFAGDDTANVLTGANPDETLIGAGGNDTLNGQGGNDLLIGGAGNDVLNGGDGADRYEIGRGTGQDIVQSLDTDGGADMLLVGPSVANDQLWFARSGDDLIVSIVGTNDRATVEGWYGGANYQLEVKLADGKYATASDVEQLVTAMASFSPPPLGQLNLDTTTRQGLTPTLAAAWH